MPAVLITGAARRIGRALALDFAGRGWAVAVHYQGSAAEAEAVAVEIAAQGGAAAAVRADLRSEDETATLVDRAGAALGRPILGLINNASVFEYDTWETADRASWDLHLQVNTRAPLVLTQHYVRGLPTGAAGCVVNLIDQRVWNLTPLFTSYTVSKAALWTLTQTLALALAPQVRVNAIGPGPTLPSRRQSEADFQRQWRSVPLARPAGVDEICRAVRFLFEAPSVTGQMIAVDGGQHLGWHQAAVAEGSEE
jgi:NAD(P)-dependent dehydrogenase (short-subunit alcohol dehydrogenase family)